MKAYWPYILPLLVVLGFAVAILNFEGAINSEIPVDRDPDPFPLSPEKCPPEEATAPLK